MRYSSRLHDACINGEALALDQTSVYAGPHHCLKRMAQDVAIAESTVAIDRERRMVRHLVVEIEPAEPPIGEVQLNLVTKLFSQTGCRSSNR